MQSNEHSLLHGLRKQPTSYDATTRFTAKKRLKNERRNSILMTRHYPDRGSACDWLKLCVAQWYCIWTSLQTPGGRTQISFFLRRLCHCQSDKMPLPCFRNYGQTYLLDMERL